MNENAVTQKLISVLNAVPNCRARKRHGGKYQSGEADVSGCFTGFAFFIEVKLEGGELTKRQATELDKWRAAWAVTAVAIYDRATKVFRVVNKTHDGTQRWLDQAGKASDVGGFNSRLGFDRAEWEHWLHQRIMAVRCL